MTHIRKAIALLAVVALSGGCTKEQGPIYVPPPIDTINGFDTVSFENEVLPIFNEHCWVCHPPNGGLDLGAELAYGNLVNVESVGFPPNKRVVPGQPMQSVLWHKVIHSGTYGLNMPPNAPISTEELTTIRAWIEQGAMNN
jgi:hypothetical protein